MGFHFTVYEWFHSWTHFDTEATGNSKMAGTKVGPDQLRSFTSDQTKNGFLSQNYLMFTLISLRLA